MCLPSTCHDFSDIGVLRVGVTEEERHEGLRGAPEEGGRGKGGMKC